MAMAVANCCFSVLSSTVKFRYSVSCRRRVATSHAPLNALSPKATNNRKRALKRSSSTSPLKSNAEKDSASQKKLPGRPKDEKSSLYADGISGRGDTGRPQLTGFKSFGTQRKDKKEFQLDPREQQVEPGHLQDAIFLNAVVKVYCTHTAPDYSLPWQKQKQYTSTGSAFMIGDGKLLTNAHCVEHDTQVKVKRRGDDTKYVAKVLARGVDCDIALLSVESEEFWKGAESLRLGHLPHLQDAVTVVGYPLGGDTISVTKGVVSRIEVTSYAHGSSDLLGIQIDAAINPGNSGGPAFNEQGECIGVAFQVYRSEEAENIGYVIPTTVVSHFLNDYERNGKYTGFPCLGVLLQKLENPALRACLQVQSNGGVLVRRVEPTLDANNVLKEGDVIVSFDDIHVGSEGTVPFRSNERIAFRYLISQKFAEPLIEEESEDSIGLKLLAKARYSLARFKGEQIVILSQVLANEVNIGYEDMSNQQVLKFNGTRIKNIRHLAHLVACCKDKYLVFEFEDNYLAVLDRKAAMAASSRILKDYGIPSERSDDLLEPYVDSLGDIQTVEQDFGDSPVSNLEIGFDGLLWA
ncbi:protease Do-like 2, chloroplastic isoform X2 [Durio zibethinus]|uniref:Protease Do-like 2, chloroplastic isoform X2 n=1 Tax=Durio zibethinus TaxID=66656 RepID=A0A6P5XGH6_DURZI|nr:protease Do-like 2, chloroplastic isoform X2 [Durio zibethinus]